MSKMKGDKPVRCKVSEMAKEIADVFEQYSSELAAVVDEGIEAQAKETVAELKKTSPIDKKHNQRRGTYAKSWKWTTADKASKRKGAHVKGAVVYSTEYRLTHLLEKGHALRNGGRAEAVPHIAPAAENAAKGLLAKIKKGVVNVT